MPSKKTEADKPITPSELPEGALEQPTAPEPDAVVVLKITDDEGNISTEVQTLGNVQITEVQTLLELGLTGFRERIFGQSKR